MAKKKPNFAEMADFSFDDEPENAAHVEDQIEENDDDLSDLDLTDHDLPKQIVGIYIKIEKHERQEIREWCVRHNKTMKDILLKGYDVMVEKEGP